MVLKLIRNNFKQSVHKDALAMMLILKENSQTTILQGALLIWFIYYTACIIPWMHMEPQIYYQS